MKNHRLKRFLIRGGVIIYPTESCFGIGCDPKNIHAINKIMVLKKRNIKKNFLLISSSLKQLDSYINNLTQTQIDKLFKKWPGPHTWVINAKENCKPWLTNHSNQIAIRIPSFLSCFNLCKNTGMALISTSANLSGKKTLKNYREVCRFSNRHVRLIKGQIGKQKKPSTIQDFATGKILRK
ncbi:MAG: L-threonylcarbamoyladenylate synthase [Methylophilaceae bacterium]